MVATLALPIIFLFFEAIEVHDDDDDDDDDGAKAETAKLSAEERAALARTRNRQHARPFLVLALVPQAHRSRDARGGPLERQASPVRCITSSRCWTRCGPFSLARGCDSW